MGKINISNHVLSRLFHIYEKVKQSHIVVLGMVHVLIDKYTVPLVFSF